jgi:hypothetical protein
MVSVIPVPCGNAGDAKSSLNTRISPIEQTILELPIWQAAVLSQIAPVTILDVGRLDFPGIAPGQCDLRSG